MLGIFLAVLTTWTPALVEPDEYRIYDGSALVGSVAGTVTEFTDPGVFGPRSVTAVIAGIESGSVVPANVSGVSVTEVTPPPPPPGSGALFDAMNALVPGQSADFPAGAIPSALWILETTNFNNIFQWGTRFCLADNGDIFMLGKGHGGSPASHLKFDGAWSLLASGLWNGELGHTYDTFKCGDGRQFTYGWNGQVREYIAGNWLDIGNVSTHNVASGMAYSPDLYGPGDGALIFGSDWDILAFRLSTGVTEQIHFIASPPLINISGSAIYHDGAVYVGGGDGTFVHFRVTPGPVVTQITDLPVETGSNEDGGKAAVLLSHGSKLYLIGMGQSADYWTSTDGDVWTNRGPHSLPLKSSLILSAHGGFWALGKNGWGDSYSKIWKP